MTPAPASGARIEVRGLTKRFGDFTAVDDLDFAVEPGRITGFLGPNGAGKTTTLRMLLGLIRPTVGHRDHRRRSATLDIPNPLLDGRRPPSRRRTSTPAAAAATTCACMAATAGRSRSAGSTSCSSWSASRRRLASGPAATRWACASGSASRPPCSATRRCSSSTSRPTASTPRASAGCAASCATWPARARPSSSRATCSPEVEQTVDDVVIIANGRSVAQGADRRPAGRADRAASAPPTATRSPARCASPTWRRSRTRPTALRVRHRGPAPRSATSPCGPACRSTSCGPKPRDLEALFFELTDAPGTATATSRGCRPREDADRRVRPRRCAS